MSAAVSTDNAAIFGLLERCGRLPSGFEKSAVTVFEEEGCFYLVIFMPEKGKKDFLSYAIDNYKLNFEQMSRLKEHLLEHRALHIDEDVAAEALDELNAFIEASRAGLFYFDAH